MSETSRGGTIEFGPFSVRVPDRGCKVTDCDEPADGVVRFETNDMSISCCVGCAPQFLEASDSNWTPLAGGRSLRGEASV